MSSKRMQDIFAVCKEMKQGILDDLDKNYEVSENEVDQRLRDACRKVAKESNREYSTVYDACTRRMNYNAKQFYDGIKEIIRQDGQSFINRMYTQMIDGEDDEWTIRKIMSDLFGLDFV